MIQHTLDGIPRSPIKSPRSRCIKVKFSKKKAQFEVSPGRRRKSSVYWFGNHSETPYEHSEQAVAYIPNLEEQAYKQRARIQGNWPAAALYIACKNGRRNTHPAESPAAARITEVTLRTRVKHIQSWIQCHKTGVFRWDEKSKMGSVEIVGEPSYGEIDCRQFDDNFNFYAEIDKNLRGDIHHWFSVDHFFYEFGSAFQWNTVLFFYNG